LLLRVIEMAVRDRRLVRTLQFVPVVVRLLAEHKPFQLFMDRLYRVLLSDAGLDGRRPACHPAKRKPCGYVSARIQLKIPSWA